MDGHLHAYSKDHQYQNCGPVRDESLATARQLAEQNAQRLNAHTQEEEWGVELENTRGHTIYHAGWKRNYPLDCD